MLLILLGVLIGITSLVLGERAYRFSRDLRRVRRISREEQYEKVLLARGWTRPWDGTDRWPSTTDVFTGVPFGELTEAELRNSSRPIGFTR